MSLRDLKGEIYLILQIKEGHNFGFATSPLVVTANLAGNVHESFIVEPSPQPKFENEFVWVMDKTKMKNIWAEKVPVRIECFAVNQTRNRIGYIILNVKDAQIAQDEAKITEKQLRLLGLSREISLLKPELILSFYITDVPIQSPQLIPQFSPRLESQSVQMTPEPLKVILGSGRDHFNLTISVVNTDNLKNLLPSQSELNPAQITYCYSLLGREVVSDHSANHAVKLTLVSNLACLKTYFLRHPAVPVTLLSGSVALGHTTVQLENVMLSEEPHSRRGRPGPRNVSCRCSITPAHILSEEPQVEAWVEFSVSFGYENVIVRKKPSAPALSTVGAGGDADNSHIVLPLKAPETPPLVTKSLPSLQPQGGQRGGGGEKRVKSGGETYRTQQQPSSTHTVTVTINSLQFEQPAAQLWIKLSHPSASIWPSQQVILPEPWTPLQYQLTVMLPRRLLLSTLVSQPLCLQLGEGDTILASASLLHPDGLTPDCITHNELLGERGQKLGEVDVTWSLQPSELTSQSAPTLTDTSLSPPTCSQSRTVGMEVLSPRARELKMLSFVEELEDWAEKQRIIVMEGLKEEEANRLASLQAQWEAEVGGQVSEGRQLVQALQNMRDQLKQQEDQLKDNQFKLKVYKEELERVHRSKLQEFRDLSRRMQDEFNHKLALIASDKAALEREVEQLRKENMEMKQNSREMEQRVDMDKRTIDSLNHEMNVLKEKLSLEQESKKFFKDHCRKAEQEIHRLNCLRQQELEARLLNDRKSVEHIAFQQIVVERNDLRQDQELLNEIRQQLLRTPAINSDSNGGTRYSDRLNDDRHIRRAT